MSNVGKNERELRKREQILNGNLWKTILIIALPILFYNLCNYLYGIYVMMIVEKANIGVESATSLVESDSNTEKIIYGKILAAKFL